jgi:O-antigen ligase
VREVKKIQNKPRNTPVSVILLAAVIITLYFNSKIQDPFNSPKMWILIIMAAWLCGYILSDFKKYIKEFRLFIFAGVIFFFILSLFFATIFTDNVYIAIFGTTQRRTGFLTYFSLAIVALSAAFYFRVNSIKRLQKSSFFVLLLLVTYGQMQINGHDFISWNNTYNAIITTLGNPNFAAALMAILATLVFSITLNRDYPTYYRIGSGALVLLTFWTIYLSNARQGLLAGALGTGILLIIYIYQKNRSLGIVAVFSALLLGFLSILGMLQIGPLAQYLFKGSISVRGHYWNTGVEMFKSNWVFGVGIDRYGEFFKEYRSVGYPLDYGFEITSNNAHNVPIQLFATGGIFVGVAYILILITTFYYGFKVLKDTKGADQILVGSVFASWIAFQSQSIVSIDNIGISIWGWILMGVLIGLGSKTLPPDELSTGKKNTQIKLMQPILSASLALVALALVAPLYQSESNMFKARTVFNPQNSENATILKEYSDKVYSSVFSDPMYKLMAATYLIDSGFQEDGLGKLSDLNREDPRNLDVLTFLAVASENLGRMEEAIKFREEIERYDPWNARNLLIMGRIYKSMGDFSKMDQMLNQIASFASLDPIYQEAKQTLSL